MNSDKKAILVVSFGTSYNDNRAKTIGALEAQISEKYPDWEVRRAFTSKMIIKKLAERDGERIDYVTDAMKKLISDGITTVVVQPTHIMNGIEYDDVVRIVSGYRSKFDSISIGEPMLTVEDDYNKVVDAIGSALLTEARETAGKKAAVILMGHGTEHYANSAYSQLQLKLILSGHDDVYITTVEGFPNFNDTVYLMKSRWYKDVILFPFMLVAGDHANNDMAGDEEDSLKSILESHGYKVHCVVKGLGEYKEFREIFLSHTKDAIKAFDAY
jgi:sirohydrochlorin cobaltochelatase